MELPKLKSAGRNVWALGLVSLFNDVSSEMIYPLLPLFMTQVLGAGTAFVGLVEGIAESTASILKLFSGWVSDRLRKRKAIVVGGYLLSSIARPAIAAATQGWHVLAVRFLDRAGKGARAAPRDALLSDSAGPENRGLAFGFQRAMDHAGAVLGPLAAIALLAVWPSDFRRVFLLAAVPAAAALLIAWLLVTEKVPPSQAAAAPPNLTLKPFSRTFKAYLLLIVIFTLGNSSDAFLLLRASDAGIPAGSLPLLWLALHVSKMAFSVPGGAASDRLGRRGVIAAGWGVYALAYAGFAAAGETWQVWGLFIFYGLYFGLTEGAEKAFVADLVPVSLRATAYGLYSFAVGIAALPASLLTGWLYQIAGPAVAFGTGAALSLAAAVGMLLLRESASRR